MGLFSKPCSYHVWIFPYVSHSSIKVISKKKGGGFKTLLHFKYWLFYKTAVVLMKILSRS